MKKTFTLSLICLFALCWAPVFSQTLVINEFDYDQPAVDTAEFIEIYNASGAPIDLGLYSVVLINGFNATTYDSIALASQLLATGDFFVICGDLGYVANCDLVRPISTNMIQNGAPDAIAIVENSSGNIIDAVSYEGSTAAPYVEGTGVDTSKADPSQEENIGLSRFPDGTDSNNNDADFNLACITPGMPNTTNDTLCASPTSVPKVANQTWLKVFPNPTRGEVFVDITKSKSNEATVSLFNVLGKEVMTATLTYMSRPNRIDLSSYEAGVYYVTVTSDKGSLTNRIILRH